MIARSFGLAALTLALTGVPALAQTSIYRSVETTPGKVVRLGVVTAVKQDCSVGTLEDVKVTTVPKNGALGIRKGKVKTPASYRCPNVETPVQAIFYTPKANFSGSDEITYEARVPGSPPQTVTVKITVTGKPTAAPAKDNKKDDIEL